MCQQTNIWPHNSKCPRWYLLWWLGNKKRIMEVWGYKIESLVKQPDARVCSNIDGWWPCLSLAWFNIYTAVSGLEYINAGRPPLLTTVDHGNTQTLKQTGTICSDSGSCGSALINMAERQTPHMCPNAKYNPPELESFICRRMLFISSYCSSRFSCFITASIICSRAIKLDVILVKNLHLIKMEFKGKLLGRKDILTYTVCLPTVKWTARAAQTFMCSVLHTHK